MSIQIGFRSIHEWLIFTHLKNYQQYCIALKLCGSKFSQIADFELFAEKFSRTAGLRKKSAKATTFSLNQFHKWLKIREIHEI